MNSVKQLIKLTAAMFPAITGSKRYIALPNGIRWGNILYFLLQAEIHGYKLIARNDGHEFWLDIFPKLRRFFIEESDIKFLDLNIKYKTFFQSYKVEFSYSHLKKFALKYFINHPEYDDYLSRTNHGTLYINIRRGDYYGTEHEKHYGFDIVGFIKYCFESKQIPNQDSIVVISDDIDWCRKNLNFLKNHSQSVDFPDGVGARESFFILSTARKLLISNSTFCYWGAYISSVNYGADSEIYAPDFINRLPQHRETLQYLPDWKIIKGFNFKAKY